jgi:2,4-dienoyl-CoA reductase-like NADH-dependent reductase (Old Yellow Enzyme family)
MTVRHMFTSIHIGQVDIKNRVVRPAHGTGLAGGALSDNLIAYHEERARGGVGLTVLEPISVDANASPSRLNPNDPDLIASYRKLMNAVRPHGMRVFQQLWHAGHNKRPHNYGAPSGPSDIPGATNPYNDSMVPVPMTLRDIARTIVAFAEQAAACEAGNLDGVEIHCAHSYLLTQFLSSNMNRRTDQYGGSSENRMRFPVDVLRAVRARVSKTFVVGIRLSPEEIQGGVNVAECCAFLQRIQDEQLIDYVSVSLGGYHKVHDIVSGMHAPTGYELETVAPITAVRRVPCIVTGRFRTIAEADQVIHDGLSDLVGMVRAHIADAYVVKKTVEGREDEVRTCIGCNQGCMANQFVVGHITCTINVGAGYERTLSEDLITKTLQPKKILVVGGGPAGLEAARVAALKGHKVVVAEATSDLGGMINIAKLAPRRGGIGDIVDWQEREVYRLGVEVRLGTHMDGDDVRAERADAVIVATGSLPRMGGFQSMVPGEVAPGHELPHVVSSAEILLDGRRPQSGVAVVFDDLGHYEAIAAAEVLVDSGAQVIFVTSHIAFAPRIEAAGMTTPALQRLSRTRSQFRVEYRSKIVRVEPDHVVIAPLYAPNRTQVIPASLLVWVNVGRANRELIDALADHDRSVIAVGDAQAPRFLQTAIREGHLAARAL